MHTSAFVHFSDFFVIPDGLLKLTHIHMDFGSAKISLEVGFVQFDSPITISQSFFEPVHLDENDGSIEMYFGVCKFVERVDAQRLSVQVVGHLELPCLEGHVSFLLLCL